MRILGFNISKILVEKKDEVRERLKLDQNIDIIDIEKEKIQISEKEALKIKFKFTITYSKDYARIEFKGAVIILPEKEELEEFITAWKSKKIPEKPKIGLFNFIMSKCNIKALNLEDELNLPYHIPMPRVAQENTSEQDKN